jgi:zinc protease
MQHIRESFGPLRPEPAPPAMRLVEPEQHGERRSDLERPGATDLLFAGWHIPPFVHDDTPALILLTTILGGWHGFTPFAGGDWRPRSTRLYRALVDGKLATEVSVRQEMKLDPTLLIASVTLANRISPDRVERVLDREVDRLQKAVPSRAEMDRARRQVRSWYRYEHDGVTFQGTLLSTLEALGSWDVGESLLAKVDRVRPEQVRAVARKYLVTEHRSVVRFHAQEATG